MTTEGYVMTVVCDDERHPARELGVSVKTAETHREHVKQRLGLKNGLALVREATLWVYRVAQHEANGTSGNNDGQT